MSPPNDTGSTHRKAAKATFKPPFGPPAGNELTGQADTGLRKVTRMARYRPHPGW